MNAIRNLASALAVLGLLGVSTVVAQQESDQLGTPSVAPRSAPGRLYDSQSVKTIRGDVVRIELASSAQGAGRGVHLLVSTDANTVPVHLGPSWFLDNQPTQLELGDQIEVTGSQVIINGKPALIAAEVRKDGQVLRLRDQSGRPAWAAWRSGGQSVGGGMTAGGMSSGVSVGKMAGGGMMCPCMVAAGMSGPKSNVASPREATAQQSRELRAQHQELLSKLRAMDADLEKKISQMNAATGDEKVQAMAHIITELVQQRKEMVTQMGQMHQGMMVRMERMMGTSGSAERGAGSSASSTEGPQ